MINQHRGKQIGKGVGCLCLFLFLLGSSCKQTPTTPPAVTKIILAEGMQPIVAPVYVADVKGFFKEEGLDVQLVPFPKGKLCLDAVLGGQAQLGTVAETPLMHVGFQKQPIAILTMMETATKNTKAVARKDRGIQKPGDIKGHKVGVPIGGNAEYFMDVFLKKYGMTRKDISVINLNPPEMVGAIVRGDIDVAFSFEPAIIRAVNQLGDKSIVFTGEDLYRETFNIVSMKDWADKNRETCQKILRALNKATQFIKSNKAESVQIVANHIQMQPAELSSIWDNYTFNLSLDELLMTAMIDQAKWAIDSKTQSAPVPDYTYMFYTEPLKAVDPGAVTIDLTTKSKAAGQ
jgi:NitT/TauT family transport system substrate-binding protein